MLAVGPNKLLLAANIGDTQQIQQLIQEEGVSPSHVFPHSGQMEAVKLFIDSGADVNKQVLSSLSLSCHLAI